MIVVSSRRFAAKGPQDHVCFHRPPISGLEAVRDGETRTLASDRSADIGITRSDIERIASRGSA